MPTCPSSGAIELSNDIGRELGGSVGAETGLKDASTGGIATINTDNDGGK